MVIKIDFEKAYDKIHWSYLLEVLAARGFGSVWIQWMTSWLTSSQSCISLNGELTHYFFCKRGVRQGDPLSPFLFILAADTLSRIFSKGRQANLIRGLGPPVHNGHAITNCHYADDTIIFLAAEGDNIENAWWGMIAFEALSGIKMNLHKTELCTINSGQGVELAARFRCKLAKFPIKYLGLPLQHTNLLTKDWDFLIEKYEHRLQGWKGSLLSIGGDRKSTRLNSSHAQ